MVKTTNKARGSKEDDIFSDEGGDDDDDIMASPVNRAPPPSKKLKHSSTSAQVSSVQAKVSSVQAKVSSVQAKVSSVQAKVSSIQAKVSTIPTQERAITKTFPELNNSVILSAPTAPTLIAPVAPISLVVGDTTAIADLMATMRNQQSQIEALAERVTQGNQAAVRDTSRFVITGIDGTSKHMIDEIFGRNFVKWFLQVIKFRFTEQEIIDNTLEPTDRSRRGHLDVDSVALLRDALSFKYKFEPEKLDKAWAAVRQAVNNKGRNLRLRQRTRQLLTQVGRGVGGVVRTISNLSLRNDA